MGTPYKNDDIRTAITNNTYLDGYSGKVPSDISKEIQLICDVTPNNNRVSNVGKSAIASNSAIQTIYNTPSDKDFYITALSLGYSLDFGNPSQQAKIQGYINGALNDFLILSVYPNNATPSNNNTSLSFIPPIKVDRGQPINMVCDSASANNYLSGCVVGYLVDTNIYDSGIPSNNEVKQ